MVYEIAEISTDKPTGRTYVLVHYWETEAARAKGDPPDLVNDHFMDLFATGERHILDAEGKFKTKDGQFLSKDELYLEVEANAYGRGPDGKLDKSAPIGTRMAKIRRAEIELEKETFDRDVMLDLIANVEAGMAEAVKGKWRGDHTSRPGTPPAIFDGRIEVQREITVELDDDYDPRGVLKSAAVAELKTVIKARKDRDRNK